MPKFMLIKRFTYLDVTIVFGIMKMYLAENIEMQTALLLFAAGAIVSGLVESHSK